MWREIVERRIVEEDVEVGCEGGCEEEDVEGGCGEEDVGRRMW